jgi:hypothetical protein
MPVANDDGVITPEDDLSGSSDDTLVPLGSELRALEPEQLLRHVYSIHDDITQRSSQVWITTCTSLWPLVHYCLDYCRSEMAAPAIWSAGLTVGQDLGAAGVLQPAFSPDQLAYILVTASRLLAEYDTLYNIDLDFFIAAIEGQLQDVRVRTVVEEVRKYIGSESIAPTGSEVPSLQRQLWHLNTGRLVLFEVTGARHATEARATIAGMIARGELAVNTTVLLSFIDKIRSCDRPSTFAHGLALLVSDQHLSFLPAGNGDPRLFWFLIESLNSLTVQDDISVTTLAPQLESFLTVLTASGYAAACSKTRHGFLLACADWLRQCQGTSTWAPNDLLFDFIFERIAHVRTGVSVTSAEILPDSIRSDLIEIMLIASRLPGGVARLLAAYAQSNRFVVINPVATVIHLIGDWGGGQAASPLVTQLARMHRTTSATLLSALSYALRRLLDTRSWDGANTESQASTSTAVLACLSKSDMSLRYEIARLLFSLDRRQATWRLLDYRMQSEIVTAVRGLPRRVTTRLAYEQYSTADLADRLGRPILGSTDLL